MPQSTIPALAEPSSPDFRSLFESAPGLYLVLTPELRIVAVSNAYLEATMTQREQIIGRHLFGVFPDNPDDPSADGVQNLDASLRRVVSNRTSDPMALQKYDIRRPDSQGGGFEERYWSPVNSPVLAADGSVRYIIHRVEDVTEFVLLAQKRHDAEKASEKLGLHVGELETEIFSSAQELKAVDRSLHAANEELEKREARLHQLLEAVPETILEVDAEGRILLVNEEGRKMFGYTREEFMHLNVESLVPEPRRKAHIHRREVFAKRPEARTMGSGIDLTALRKDGSVVPVEVSLSPTVLDGVLKTIVTVRDTTQRKQAEEAKRQSEVAFRALAELVPQLVWMCTPDGLNIYFNQRWVEYTGLTLEESYGRGWNTPFHPDDKQPAWDAWNHAVANGGTYRIECRLRGSDGNYRWFLTCGEPMRDAAGKVEKWFGTCTDIEDLKRAAESLRSAALYTRSLIEASLDPLVTISLEGKITDVNAATEAATGLARDQLIGTDFCDYFTETERARKGYQQVLTKGSVRDYPLAIEHVSGKVTPVVYNAALFRNQAGQVEGIFAAARDISERMLLEEQLIQAQKMEAIGRLAGGVAHDFNNMLGVVLGYAGLTLEKLPPDSPARRSIENIQVAAERAAGVTRQLLAFSRKQVLQPRIVDLNVLITEHTKMLSHLIGENIELRLNLPRTLSRVRVDPVQMEQVLMNLALNARDAMPQGGRLTITTANVDLDEYYPRTDDVAAPGSYVMVSVSDTGSGMDENTRAHLFEPFFTTKILGKGTGFGLSIVYGVVKQSGGHIWVYSEPTQGTTFKIYLPATDVSAEIEVKPQPARIVRGSGIILVAEDEVALLDLTRAILEAQGYTILTAKTGEQALSIANSHQGPIRLLLTDIVLSGRMNGIEVASRLRAERPETNILYMSGYSEALTLRRETQPTEALLEKPFTAHALRTAVAQVLADSTDQAATGS